VRLWNIKDEGLSDEETVRVLNGHKGNVHAVAFSKEGMLVSENWCFGFIVLRIGELVQA
jgi:hypothetical protein